MSANKVLLTREDVKDLLKYDNPVVWANIAIQWMEEAEKEIIKLQMELSICHEAIEVCYDTAKDYFPQDSDSDSAVRRCTMRKLNEAVGKALPKLMFEQPEGQQLYGLRWRELVAERDALKARVSTITDECNKLRAALTELVACQDLKYDIYSLRSDPYYTTDADRAEAQYERRKPAAWAAAREVLKV